MYKVLVLPRNISLDAPAGENLQRLLQRHGVAPAAPCGGNGQCGKCAVTVNGYTVQSCRLSIAEDMVITIPDGNNLQVLKEGITVSLPFAPVRFGYLATFDIGTTTVVCYLLDSGDGHEITSRATENPQRAWGSDVVSRIQAAARGEMAAQTHCIRNTMTALLEQCCADAKIKPNQIRVIGVVGNPAMQQLFLGISIENLIQIPFSPVLTAAKEVPASDYLEICPDASLLIIPDISAYVGADTVACILASNMHRRAEMTLLVDIGTNGEIVLGNRDRMIACATAAGPALEGAEISCGMAAQPGAIDHVWLEREKICYSVIGGGPARGICGSGLIDAAAVHLQLGNINPRGKITGTSLPITGEIALSQEDIRHLQLAKGAVCAGVQIICTKMGIRYDEIHRVLLAGGFGNRLNTENTCRIGLLPTELLNKITPVGNAAGSGAKLLAQNEGLMAESEQVARNTEYLELSQVKEFPKAFAQAMRFPAESFPYGGIS